ncbi:MAG: glycosyltransferase [Synergistaceae bacterium]|jgi:rhamnopyranosyl-N-acetylglucosaminyl-diphospho-decaprenol beta-1,3/1,4-galactofuranosyltransferase|nr:glycosyltransferase [Synergistaceae bacterium]
MRTNEKSKICVATVAYNNPGELSGLFESLSLQTRPINGIVVVDNSESEDMAKANRAVFDEFAKAVSWSVFVPLYRNTGSAGGFRRAMELAHKENFDWIWMLDQDGLLEGDCLERMAAHLDEAKILCARVLSAEDRKSDLAFTKKINFWGRLLPIAQEGDYPVKVSLFCTHGTLLGRDAIDAVGYYDDENFFFRWEDLDYGYRVHAKGISALLIRDAIAYHPERAAPKASDVYPSGLAGKFVFYIRNIFPLFLPCDWRLDSESDVLSHNSYKAIIRKHIKGYKFWGALFFSVFFLLYAKCRGAAIPLGKTIRDYIALRKS